MIYAIGDIHGMLSKLELVLAQIEPLLTPEDRLVFLGDYIDRGPESKGVVDRMLPIKAERPNTVFLRGNHEQMMMEMRAFYDRAYKAVPAPESPDQAMLWIVNGGQETLQSYSSKGMKWWESIPAEHWEFFGSTTLEFSQGRYRFVHAGFVPPGETWLDDNFDPRLWIREPFLSHPSFIEGQIVVFGHTPMTSGKPLVMRNKVGIDTGAVFGGPLTCLAVDPEALYDPLHLKLFQA